MAKGSRRTQETVLHGQVLYVLRYKAYANWEQKVDRLLTGERRGLLWTWLLAEVKREGFYEAVTADKVSLSPHRRVYSARYCTQAAVRQSTYPAVLRSLTFSRWFAVTLPRSIWNRLRAPFSPFCPQLVLFKLPLRSYPGVSALSRMLPGFSRHLPTRSTSSASRVPIFVATRSQGWRSD